MVNTLQSIVVFVGRLLVTAMLVAAQNADSDTAGIVVQPEEGEVLDLCRTPELSVNIKVSPGSNGPSFAMGTAELAAHSENFGTYEAFDEVIFIHHGQGSVTVGEAGLPCQLGNHFIHSARGLSRIREHREKPLGIRLDLITSWI